MAEAYQKVRRTSPYLNLALLAGMGFYWAWLSLVFYSPSVSPHAGSVSAHVQDIWVWSAWAHAIFLLLAAFFARRVKTVSGMRAAVPLWTLITFFGTLLLPLGSVLPFVSPELSAVSVRTGAIITGIATAFIVLMWGEVYAKVGIRSSLIGIILSHILGSVLYFIITALPFSAVIFCVVLLPLPCGVCLSLINKRMCGHPAHKRSTSRKVRFSPRILIPIAAIILYALCGEILRAFATTSGDGESLGVMGGLYVLGGMSGLLVLLVLTLVAPKIIGPNADEIVVIRVALLIMAAGFLATALFGVSFFVAYAIFGAAFQCFRSIVWAYSTHIAETLDTSPLRVFGFIQASFAFAVVAGAPIAQGLTSVVLLGVTEWSSIALIMIFLIFTSAVFILSQRDTRTIWGLAENAASPEAEEVLTEGGGRGDIARSHDLSFLQAGYGLSIRELEVARLLARGRSLPFIQDELHIAKGTAQTHLNHIYKKLGVHSRQEFLDLVERDHNGRNPK